MQVELDSNSVDNIVVEALKETATSIVEEMVYLEDKDRLHQNEVRDLFNLDKTLDYVLGTLAYYMVEKDFLAFCGGLRNNGWDVAMLGEVAEW